MAGSVEHFSCSDMFFDLKNRVEKSQKIQRPENRIAAKRRRKPCAAAALRIEAGSRKQFFPSDMRSRVGRLSEKFVYFQSLEK
jgi:hypothetical protein